MDWVIWNRLSLSINWLRKSLLMTIPSCTVLENCMRKQRMDAAVEQYLSS